MDGDSWDASLNQWLDKSGNNNHSDQTGGTVSVGTWAGGYGTEEAFPFLYGDVNAGVRIESGWPSYGDYTFFHVTRYNGGSKGRIWNGSSGNWLSGHWWGYRGAFYHDGWFTYGQWAPSTDNWGIYSDRRNRVATDRGTFIGGGGDYSPVALGINAQGYGSCCSNERSDWAAAVILVYNRELSDDETRDVEDWLYDKYFA